MPHNNLKEKGKGNLIMYGYANNSVATTWNGLVSNNSVVIIRSGLVEVSQTEIKVTKFNLITTSP